MNEPREWYFNPVSKYRCEVNEDGIGLSGNEVHVIEKSAFTELQAQADKLQKTLGMVTCVGSPYDKIIMEALSNYAKFKESR